MIVEKGGGFGSKIIVCIAVSLNSSCRMPAGPLAISNMICFLAGYGLDDLINPGRDIAAFFKRHLPLP